jgi:hypothetical protein
MTGLKPDGGPECTGIFRSRPAFDVDSGLEHSGPVFTSYQGGSDRMLTQFHADRCVSDNFQWRPVSLDAPAPPDFNCNRLYRADVRKMC